MTSAEGFLRRPVVYRRALEPQPRRVLCRRLERNDVTLPPAAGDAVVGIRLLRPLLIAESVHPGADSAVGRTGRGERAGEDLAVLAELAWGERHAQLGGLVRWDDPQRHGVWAAVVGHLVVGRDDCPL